jgi:hypothetical protein
MPIQTLGGAAQQAPQLGVGFKSLQQSQQRDCVTIIGKPKDGKTTCLLTASPKYDPSKRGDGVLVDDIGLITFDATALAYARATGYEFKYWIDMADFLHLPLGEFDKVLDSALGQMRQLAADKVIHTLGIDPVSTLDYYWKGELSKNYEKWPLMDQIDLKHKRFLLEKVMPIPCNTILTMHTKTLGGSMDAEKKASLGLDQEDRVVMDLSSWNGPKMYRTQSSLTLPLKKTWGTTYQQDKYALYPRGVDGMESGGRYPQILQLAEVPADMKRIFELIKQSAVAKPTA